MTITTTEIKRFRTSFAEAVKGLEKEYDVKIQLGSISYGAFDFGARLKVKKNTREANAFMESQKKTEFDFYAETFNFPKELFGSTITNAGKTYKVTGVKPTARKNIIMLEHAGKTYTCSVSQLKTMVSMSAFKK